MPLFALVETRLTAAPERGGLQPRCTKRNWIFIGRTGRQGERTTVTKILPSGPDEIDLSHKLAFQPDRILLDRELLKGRKVDRTSCANQGVEVTCLVKQPRDGRRVCNIDLIVAGASIHRDYLVPGAKFRGNGPANHAAGAYMDNFHAGLTDAMLVDPLRRPRPQGISAEEPPGLPTAS